MADRFIPIRQNVQPTVVVQPPKLPDSYNPEGPSDLTFESVLSRQQLSAANLKTMRTPSFMTVPSNSAAPTAPSTPTASVNGVTFTGLQGPVQSIDPEVLETSSSLISNMPVQHPQGIALENEVINNLKQGQTWRNAPSADINTTITTAGEKGISQSLPPNQKMSMKASFSPASFPQNTGRLSRAGSMISQYTPDQAPLTNQPAFGTLAAPQNTAGNAVSSKQSIVPEMSMPAVYQQALAASSTAPAGETPHTDARKTQFNTGERTHPQPSKRKGFFQAAGSIFTNLASGLTFGIFRPKGEEAPQGLARVAYPFKKLVWDTPKSIIVDTPVGIYHSAGQAFNKGKDASSNSEIASASTAPGTDNSIAENSRRRRAPRFSIDSTRLSLQPKRRSLVT